MIAERDLTDFVGKLKDAVGEDLLSVVLYGSAVRGDFHAGHSDLNVLCILRTLGRDELSRLHAASAWWVKKGHPQPLCFTLQELQHAADIFAIELLDMQAAHRVLYGEDQIASLRVPLHLHRLQVERELRNNTLRLRQHYLRHPADSRRTMDLMTSSISTFATLFRHALIALGDGEASGKRDAFDRLATLLAFDPAPFHTILGIREGQKRGRDVDAQATFDRYLRCISRVTDEIDRRLESSQPTA